MTLTIESTRSQWTNAVGHLRGAHERVLFFAAAAAPGRAVVEDCLLLDDSDLEPGPWCVQMTDEAQQRVFRWAAKRDGWLIEAHSHLGRLGDPAKFSSVDTSGLTDWVPHVRWRLRGRPYAALVFGPKSIDGVGWVGAKGIAPVPVAAWDAGGVSSASTGLSIGRFAKEER